MVQLRYKGIQKQFEFNDELDVILECIGIESQGGKPVLQVARIKKSLDSAREHTRKRKQLIKITRKNMNGWQVV